MNPTETLDFSALAAKDRIALAGAGPSSVFMTGEDALQISGWGIVTGASIRVSGRFLGLDGIVRPFEHDCPLTADRVIASVARQIGEGWLLNLTARNAGTANAYGQVFARVQVVRGLGASGAVLGTLCAGYVTAVQPLAFPGGRVRSTHDGVATIRSITGTDPAAGVEISETVPTGARWRLISFFGELVTDATVANRRATLAIDDGTNLFFRVAINSLQTASLTFRYIFSQAGPDVLSTGNAMVGKTPNDLRLAAGYRIRTITETIQAGDNWAAPQLLVEEFLEGSA